MTTLMFERPRNIGSDKTRSRRGHESASAKLTTGRRLQNRSCDQCRKGKRGCDAVLSRKSGLFGLERDIVQLEGEEGFLLHEI
jgi:hypothetical protein